MRATTTVLVGTGRSTVTTVGRLMKRCSRNTETTPRTRAKPNIKNARFRMAACAFIRFDRV